MTNVWRQAVNAHLRKATALIELQQTGNQTQLSRLAVEALSEAALLQLRLAYVAFMREIAENYQAPDAAAISSSAALSNSLGRMDKQPAELNEIVSSEQEGWLRPMLASWSRVGQLPQTAGSKPAAPIGMIQTRQLDETSLDIERLENWLLRLRELVERQREMMVEC